MSAVPVQQPTPPKPEESPVLLRALGLSKAFGGQVVLDNVGLELRQGEVVLLRGENGSGKTTLLNILTGNLEPDAGEIHYLADGSPRSYRFPRRWWQELNPFDHFTPEFVAREGIGRTWQDVRLFGSQTLRENLAVATPGHPGENPLLALFAPHRAAGREAEINQAADAMLARLGLAGREDSSADKISLGQSKRVAIARAVLAGAKILFLDEPLAGLDRQGIADVLDLLQSLVSEQRLTLVIVEHLFNQPHLQGLVTTDWLLENAGITVSTPKPHIQFSSTNATRPAWFSLLAGEDAEIIDERLPRGAMLTRIRSAGFDKTQNDAILAIRGLVVKRGVNAIVGASDNGNIIGFDLDVYKGETLVLEAPNGWGKTTLLLATAGIVPTCQGKIEINGKNVILKSIWERNKLGLNVLLSSQHNFNQLTVDETILMSQNSCASNSDYIKLYKNKRTSFLSGGERQRLALRCVCSGQICIYDEPFSTLDSKILSDNPIFSAIQGNHANLVLLPRQTAPF